MKDPFKIFNLNEFKKWVEDHNDEDSKDIIGSHVESKVSLKKLSEVSEVLKGDEKKVLKEFQLNGGLVLSEDKNVLLIQNKKGKFETHKMYVKS